MEKEKDGGGTLESANCWDSLTRSPGGANSPAFPTGNFIQPTKTSIQLDRIEVFGIERIALLTTSTKQHTKYFRV
ncbi:unnamed protein product, partial [Nesidiocoris tenuis]